MRQQAVDGGFADPTDDDGASEAEANGVGRLRGVCRVVHGEDIALQGDAVRLRDKDRAQEGPDVALFADVDQVAASTDDVVIGTTARALDVDRGCRTDEGLF